jgi:small subunit ribosomal protein S8
MTNDNISDMLTRLRNASMAKHSFARVVYSNVNVAILKVLLAEGYIRDYDIETEMKTIQDNSGITTSFSQIPTNKKSIRIFLKYKGWWIKKSFFSILKRISKPGKRIFSSYKQFNDQVNVLRYEQGIAIISTSSGVMSHLKATKLKKGGEILCYIG